MNCIRCLFLVGTMCLTVSAQVVEKKTLTLEGAKKVIAAAEAEAVKNHVGCNIAVVDDGGNLVAFHRVDPTFPAGAHVSIGKARTAALFRQPTRNFEDAITKQGRTSMIALADFTPLQGGVPIVVGGDIVGAIGVSGAASAQQDEEFARMGAAANISGRKTLANTDANGVVLHGYDPVSYFTEGKAARGDERFKTTHQGHSLYFVSDEHRKLFEQDPAKYVPQYGGYCAMAVSMGMLEDADPTMFVIHQGKLLVQRNEKAHQMFMMNTEANHKKADAQWPALVETHGK